MTEEVRLGGMALTNGVLVHGPRHWACAVRTDQGELKVASGAKRIRSVDFEPAFLRGPARVVEAVALLPAVRAALPEARLPFQQVEVTAAMLGSAAVVRMLRASRLSPPAQEVLSAFLAIAPAAAAVRGSSLAAYHGAEHVSIGTYEHGVPRPREHERCGSHMVGPLLAATAAGNLAVGRIVPGGPRLAFARALSTVGAVAVAVEIFGWMVRNPRHPLARALAWPGHELQRRFLTAEPSPLQVEVAEAALAECLRLEGAASL